MNNVLPVLTYEEKLAELQDRRLALELKPEIGSYEAYANEFLALASEFLAVDAMSGYSACMKRYSHYIGLAGRIEKR
jgi:hypothetical protein